MESERPPAMSESALPQEEDPSFPTLPPRSSAGWQSLRGLSRIRTRRHTSGSTVTKTSSESNGPLGLNLLVEPSEPRVDFIFIHGLKGGSRKTWTYEFDPDTFWPQEWLPSEPGFKHVRIHSFGYNSEWLKIEESILSIHDFGQALLTDMFNSPHLRKNEDTPIVLIAHSMGGLVAKKAYLLAKHNPTYENLVKRIHTMYFFATPHRGSNMAQVLSSLLSVFGRKQFVDELIPGCSILEDINDEFRSASDGLRLWSFFETVPMKSVFVVEKDSAILGLPGEQVRYLDADHRQICKFKSPKDPNYRAVLNCLHSTAEDAVEDYLSRHRSEIRKEMERISDFLKVNGQPKRDLLDISEKQAPGTCAWLTDHQTFKFWLSGPPESDTNVSSPPITQQRPRFFWLHGPPGSGKSIMCSHVIQFLEGCNLDCHYYFIKHENAQELTPDVVLRSMAYQMAACNPDVRKAVLAFAKDNDHFRLNDHNKVWGELFMKHIFQTSFSSPQFWVIDALDEFPIKGLGTLLGMLSNVPPELPLQVFLASRPSVQVPRALGADERSIKELEIGGHSSESDILSFLRSQSSCTGIELSEVVISKVLSKSKGIFLWVSLVLDELQETYTEEDMERVLNDVPGEMNALYLRIARTIASNSENLRLVKSIFTWMICAPRPLTVAELRGAVRSDINRTVRDDGLIPLCGNLVKIDAESMVRFIHETVSSFIVHGESELKTTHAEGHRRLATVCLRYLTGPDFPPRESQKPKSLQPHEWTFPAYSCRYFSFHLAQCEFDFEPLLLLLDRFFDSKVLSWIEHLIPWTSQEAFNKSIENLRAFLSKCTKHIPQPNKRLEMAMAWLNDLSHVAKRFGSQIAYTPSCIRTIVPVISPPESMIHQRFSKEAGRHKLLGTRPDREWGERLKRLSYESKVTAIASSEEYVAVGLADGTIHISVSDASYGVKVFHNGDKKTVKLMEFSPTGGLLAVYRSGVVSCLDTRDWKWVWEKKTVGKPREPISIAFSVTEDEILVCARGGFIYLLSAANGSQLDELPLFHTGDSDSEDETRKISPGTPPFKVCMSPVHGLAAITYRCAPVTIWDIQRRRKEGVFYRPGTEYVYQQVQVHDLVFNPNPQRDLLAIAYDDVGIVTCDPWEREQLDVITPIQAHALASSPDGRLLFAGDQFGVIHIFTFESHPKVLHAVAATSFDLLESISISPNGLHFYGRLGICLDVWELPQCPRWETFDNTVASAVLRNGSVEQSLRVVSASLAQVGWGLGFITVIESSEDNRKNIAFCGRQDGSISIYDISKCTRLVDFQLIDGERTSDNAIKYLKWHEQTSILLSVNKFNSCTAARISASRTSEGSFGVELSPLFSRYANDPVRGVLINDKGNLFHIATSRGAEVWNLHGECVSQYNVKDEDESDPWGKNRQWLQHPLDGSLLLMIRPTRIHVFRWENLEELTPADGLLFTITGPARNNDLNESSPPAEWVSQRGMKVLLRLSHCPFKPYATFFEFLNLDCLNDAIEVAARTDTTNDNDDHRGDGTVTLESNVFFLPAPFKAFLGIHKETLYYLSRGDAIYSVPIKVLQPPPQLIAWRSFRRHFFIPGYWDFGEDLKLCLFPKSNSVAMACQEKLLIFHRFLDLEEIDSTESLVRDFLKLGMIGT